MAKPRYFECECGSTTFHIIMDNDWGETDIDPETGQNKMTCRGAIACTVCGKNFMKMGR